MRRPLLLLAALVAALGASAPAASAQTPFAPCTDAGFQAFECATLPQPLDRSGAVGGQVDLAIRRLRSTPGGAQTRTALVPLAGGPGQAATPIAASFAQALATGLRERDMLVFDQRGTGRSGPLSCRALRRRGRADRLVAACSQELGATRGLYRSIDSADDLEAVRNATGYEKLAIYGVSYGTKVALDYAAKYPGRVERLVLDSVVGQAGPDPLQRSSFAAVSPVLRQLCAGGRCEGVTPGAVADVRTLIRRGRLLRGSIVTSRGRRQRVTLEPQAIYAILVAGDLNPAWRALTPGAVRAAVRGDTTPILRLGAAALGASGLQTSDQAINSTLRLATLCEDVNFPWNRASGVDQRADQALNALRGLPSSAFLPFDRDTAISYGILGDCLGWQNATPAPAGEPAPLPQVPTLVLNGTADLRTPAGDAAAVAARIPGAQLVTVPNVGHSVLGSDRSGCAGAAIAGFFTGNGVTPCPPAAPAVRPISRPVRSLNELPVTAGIRGRVGRTVTAVLRTRDDVLVSALGEQLGANRSRFGGLRGGTITQTASQVTLRRVSVVPGVTVSGSFGSEGTARLTVSGSRAARGTLTFSRDERVTGRLGGRTIRLVPRARASSVTPDTAPLRYPALVRGS